MIRLKEILLEAMTLDVADTIFSKFGVQNASSLDKGRLKDYYIALVKKHHPDVGGSNENMRYINAAYDVLKTSDPSVRLPPKEKSPSPYKTYPKDPSTMGMFTTRVTVSFRSVLNGKLLFSGKCDRIDFLAILRKLKDANVYFEIEPGTGEFDYAANQWRSKSVTLNVDVKGFSRVLPDLVQHFKG